MLGINMSEIKCSQSGKEERFLSFFIRLFGLMMAAVVFSLLFLFRNVPNSGWWNRPTDMLSHGMCLYLGVLLFILLYGAARCSVGRIKEEHQLAWFLWISAAIALLQLYFVWNYYFHSGWDVDTVIKASFQYAETGAVEEGLASVYFSRYPNNRMLVLLYGNIIQPFLRFGKERAYCALLGFQSLLGWLTGFLLWMNIRKLTKNNVLAWFGYGIYLFLGEYSPWLAIPYSDAMALPFPILLFSIWTWKPEKNGLLAAKWMLMGLFACLGCLIKVQSTFLLIAVIIIDGGLRLLRREIAAGNFCRCVLPFLAAFLLMWAGSSAAMNRAFPTQNKEIAFGPAHYLMMGMSDDGLGGYSQEAVDLSSSAETRQERTALDLQKLKENVHEYGAGGILKQIVGKTIGNYGDGTFAWGIEGNFYLEVLPEKNSTVSPFLRSLFYGGEDAGPNFRLWFGFSQMLWMALLLAAFFAAFNERRVETAVLMLSVCGLTLFEALFESRARFLFSSLSLFILLGTLGMQALTDEAWIVFCREKQGRMKAALIKPISLGGQDFSNSIGMFDAAKGLFILAMIIGHAQEPFVRFWDTDMQRSGLQLLSYIVYRPVSYLPIPALFMMCGYGFRKRKMNGIVKSQVRYIWKPYVVMAGAVCLGTVVLHCVGRGSQQGLLYSILPYLLGSCPRGVYFGVYMDSVGPVWFIVTYVVAGILLNLVLQTEEQWGQWLLVFMMACAGVLLKDVRLPWCFQQALICTLFMYIGWLIKKEKFLTAKIPRYILLLCMVFLLAVSAIGEVDVSQNTWGKGMADVITSAVGGVGLLALAVRVNRFSGKWIEWICSLGRRMMQFCCVHTVFYSLIPRDALPDLFAWHRQLGIYCSIVFYTFTGIGGCWLIDKLKHLKRKRPDPRI